MTLDEMRESLRRVVGVDVPFDPQGPGPHALRRLDGQNSRQAETYRAGRILLLGDAAHRPLADGRARVGKSRTRSTSAGNWPRR